VKVCRLLHQMDSRMPELELSKLELPEFCDDAPSALDSLAASSKREE
jgi:serine O-acetyltransferase